MDYKELQDKILLLIKWADKEGLRPNIVHDILQEAAESMGEEFDLTDFYTHNRKGAFEIGLEQERVFRSYADQSEVDDGHVNGELIDAAICFLDQRYRSRWPFGSYDISPDDRRQNLIKAGALIASEIDRMDRSGSITTDDD